jgi:hypothetical protein
MNFHPLIIIPPLTPFPPPPLSTDEKTNDRMERVSSSLISPTAPLSSPEWSHAWNDRFVRALELDDIHQRSEIITELSTDFVRIAKICGRLIIAELFQSPSRQTLAKKTIGGVAGGDKFSVQGGVLSPLHAPNNSTMSVMLTIGILFKLSIHVNPKQPWYLYGGAKRNRVGDESRLVALEQLHLYVTHGASQSLVYCCTIAGHELKSGAHYAKLNHRLPRQRSSPSSKENTNTDDNSSDNTSDDKYDMIIHVPMFVIVHHLGYRLLAMPLLPISQIIYNIW